MNDQERNEPADKKAEELRLPARLREKLGGAETSSIDWEPEKRSPVGLIVTIIVVLAAIGGGWWLYQNHQTKVKAEAARVAAEQAHAKAVADSIAAARVYADSVAAAARADSIAAFNALPKWKQRQIVAAQQKAAGGGEAKPAASGGSGAAAASGGGTEAATETPEETGPFALDAGQFLFEAPAAKAAETLKASTGLDAVVKAVGSGDNATYHVYLGKYSSRAAAVKAANDLLAAGTVTQARVVTAP